MDDYLAKPVSAEQLESVLRRWLDTPGPAAPPADAAPPAPASPVLPSETLDPATVGRLRDLARVAGAGFLSGLLEAFLVQAAESSRALWIAVLDGDRERVRRQAHRLRGSSLNLGATALASLCRELEQEAGVEAPGTGFQRLRRLDAELTRVGREAPLAFGGTA
jgi:HPt (histidine-containing phosphotransfer) domain-containing protein